MNFGFIQADLNSKCLLNQSTTVILLYWHALMSHAKMFQTVDQDPDYLNFLKNEQTMNNVEKKQRLLIW